MLEMLTSIRKSNFIRVSFNGLTLLLSLLALGNGDGVVQAIRSSPAISVEKLEEILTWKDEKCSMDDIVTRLRQRTVPIGYDFHTLHQGDLYGGEGQGAHPPRL